MKLEKSLSRVFEDNEACRILASSEMPKMTPRSKHIAVKYHWFLSKLNSLNGKILAIDTSVQLVDIFIHSVEKEKKNRIELYK